MCYPIFCVDSAEKKSSRNNKMCYPIFSVASAEKIISWNNRVCVLSNTCCC